MHFSTDIEERGQIPNVSQLDPSQRDRQTRRGEERRGVQV